MVNTRFKKGQVPWNKGKHHTPEVLLKISKASKKAMNEPGLRKRMVEIYKERKGIRLSQKTEFKKGLTPWNKGKKLPETSEFSRQNILKQYESGVFPRQENTKPERQIKEELLKRGYLEGEDFIHQYKFNDKFMCDFCFPKQKIIVEAYGDFWHANPKKYAEGSKLHPHQIKDKRIDKSKEAYITKVDNHSWTYLILWEMDIKKDVKVCVDKIEAELNKRDKFK